MVLSFTMGTLRSSQSSRAAGLSLALRKMGSAMMSLSAARIEGPRAYWTVTWSVRRVCSLMCGGSPLVYDRYGLHFDGPIVLAWCPIGERLVSESR